MTTTLGDALFWLCYTSLVCVLILTVSGEVRFYTFLGMAAGFLLYNRFLRRRVVALETRIGEALLCPLRFFKGLLLTSFHSSRDWRCILKRRRVRQ